MISPSLNLKKRKKRPSGPFLEKSPDPDPLPPLPAASSKAAEAAAEAAAEEAAAEAAAAPSSLPPLPEIEDLKNLPTGKPPVKAETPAAPPSLDSSSSLLKSVSGIAQDESYSNDEKALNHFLKLHPMCSLEATSSRTLQLLSTMIEKSSVQSLDVPCVPKSHDDLFLS